MARIRHPYVRVVMVWVAVSAGFLLALIIVGSLAYRSARRGKVTDAPAGTLSLSSPVFINGGMIPPAFTCDGRNASPALAWSGVPEGTASFALVVEDPDAPFGNFTHWMIAEVSGQVGGLPEGVPTGDVIGGAVRAVQGLNGFHRSGYGGPCPPAGKTHRYYFRLYAIDQGLDLPGAFNKAQLRAAMSGHILGEATLMGRYERPE